MVPARKMTSAHEGYTKTSSSARRHGGGGVVGHEGQGPGGARWGGRERVHRRVMVRVVLDSHGAPQEAATAAQGAPRADQPCLHRASDSEEVEEGEVVEGGKVEGEEEVEGEAEEDEDMEQEEAGAEEKEGEEEEDERGEEEEDEWEGENDEEVEEEETEEVEEEEAEWDEEEDEEDEDEDVDELDVEEEEQEEEDEHAGAVSGGSKASGETDDRHPFQSLRTTEAGRAPGRSSKVSLPQVYPKFTPS